MCYPLVYEEGHFPILYLSFSGIHTSEIAPKSSSILDFDKLADYMKSESYFSVDGRPVILITPANLSSSALLSVDFSKVIPRLKSDLKRFYSMNPYIIGEMGTGWVAPVNYADIRCILSMRCVLKNGKPEVMTSSTVSSALWI